MLRFAPCFFIKFIGQCARISLNYQKPPNGDKGRKTLREQAISFFFVIKKKCIHENFIFKNNYFWSAGEHTPRRCKNLIISSIVCSNLSQYNLKEVKIKNARAICRLHKIARASAYSIYAASKDLFDVRAYLECIRFDG